MSETDIRPYFRRDQASGISPPDLNKDYSYVDHIVHARGKRTNFTSVSLDLDKIRIFGETSYQFKAEAAAADGHGLVEHERLLAELQRVVLDGEKGERLKAIQAHRYAKMRREGLVDWRFDTSRIERKDVMTWAYRQIQPYFTRL